MKKHWIRIALGLVVVVIFLLGAGRWIPLPLLDKLESIVYDTRLNLTMPRTVDDRIVIVDIDEKSLAEKEKGGEGRWPWPRDRLALMLDKLFNHYQIRIAGFDVVFAERDESSGLKVMEKLAQNELRDVGGFQSALKQLEPQLDYDRIFADRMRDQPVVLGYVFTHENADAKGALPAPVLPAGTFAGKDISFSKYSNYTGNLAALQEAAASGGYFSVEPDDDGIMRRVPMLLEYKGAYYEPLSLAMARLLAASPPLTAEYAESRSLTHNWMGFEQISAGPLRVPVDEKVSALIPYRGRDHSFPYVSAVDVINEQVPMEALKDKIVLVGTTAAGLQDLRATPVGSVYPGVEIHANLIAGMLDHNIKQKPPYVIGAEFMTLLVFGLAGAVLLPLLSPVRALLATIVLVALSVGLNLVTYQYGNLVLPLASSLVMLTLLYAVNASYGYFVEARGKRQITSLFGQYAPPEVVDEMSQNPEAFSMEGESRELTVLFTDVRGFTTISEGMDPRQLSQLMNQFLTPLTEIIYKHRGTIDKYMGDCIMAFWGAPLDDPAHAKHAVLAGLEMHETLRRLQPDFKARGWPEIRIGVGLNSGRMSVGNMGSTIRLAYTVMGDAVNLASRLEGITKEYGADIIVGESTRNAVPEVVFRELDRVRVKGKDEAVAIHEPVGLQGQVPKAKLDEIKLYGQFLRLYRAQDWDQAELQLFNLQKMAPDNALYRDTFVERIAYLRANPPGPGWDGAFTFKTK